MLFQIARSPSLASYSRHIRGSFGLLTGRKISISPIGVLFSWCGDETPLFSRCMTVLLIVLYFLYIISTDCQPSVCDC